VLFLVYFSSEYYIYICVSSSQSVSQSIKTLIYVLQANQWLILAETKLSHSVRVYCDHCCAVQFKLKGAESLAEYNYMTVRSILRVPTVKAFSDSASSAE